MPLFAAWAHSGRGERVRLPDDTVVDLAQAFRVGLVEGTNPSSLWPLRSLIAGFYLPDTSDFWTSAGEPLPVERGDYRVLIPAAGWTVVGNRKSRSITIEKPGALPRHRTRLAGYGPLRRVLALLYPSPHRPDNYGAKYGRGTYSSSDPLCS
jgi:hypothetical protein